MEAELSKYLKTLEKGEKIFLILTGLSIDGDLEEVLDNAVVLSNAISRPGNKKEYHLTIRFETIYGWGRKQKKQDKAKKKDVDDQSASADTPANNKNSRSRSSKKKSPQEG